MKFLLFLVMSVALVTPTLASTNKWTPKYQKKKLDKKLTFEKKKATKAPVKEEKQVTKIAKPVPAEIKANPLYKLYSKKYKSKAPLENLKKKTLEMKQKAVPLLTYVMKTNTFPENNRWVATFMLGRIMGVKAAPFISKFSFHPNWMLRLASLKTLLALNQKKFKGIYTRLLKDKAMIVRVQALENIRSLKLNDLAPYVWAMLYDKKNYVSSEGTRKRGSIIKTIIKTMGDLEFKKARKPMLTMIQKKKYSDIHEELDYALSKISDRPSPKGDLNVKQHFWKKQAVGDVIL